MRRLGFLLPLALAGCGDEPDRGFAATAGGARQEPYVAVPPGSVPRGTDAREAVLAPPGPAVTPLLLAAGRRAWRGKCAPCHGIEGGGDGPVVEKGFPRPPPFSQRQHSAAEIVAIVTLGRGQMPAMAEEVAPLERWAVARYIERATGAGGGADAR